MSLRGLVWIIIVSGSSRGRARCRAPVVQGRGPVAFAQIPAALEDRFDALARGAAEAHGERARGLQAPLAVLAARAQESQTGSIALLGMGLGAQQVLDDGAGVQADRPSPLDQALRRPLGVREVRLRHVLAQGRVCAALVGAHVTGDALAPEEHLDGGGGEARPHAMADQGVRHAVVVAIDIDVVVEGDGAFLPLGEHVGRRRQRAHRRPVERLEDAAPGARQSLERTIVEVGQERSDRRVEFLQAEEALMAQPREHPAIHQ